MNVSRTQSRSMPCPYCKALPGKRCWIRNPTYTKLRAASHMERVHAFIDTQKAKVTL